MRVVLVRHGETLSNRGRLALGRLDPPLSDVGLRQAAVLAEAIAHGYHHASNRISAVYTSPLLRARQTAQIIAKRLGFEDTTVLESLTEMDVGETDGMSIDEVRQRYPDFMRRWATDLTDDLKMPGGESLDDVLARAWPEIDRLREAHAPDETVVAVSHNFVLHVLVCRVLGMELRDFRRFQQDLASLTTIDFGAQRTRITALNETCHLEELLEKPGPLPF